jgi:hypothetical protein
LDIPLKDADIERNRPNDGRGAKCRRESEDSNEERWCGKGGRGEKGDAAIRLLFFATHGTGADQPSADAKSPLNPMIRYRSLEVGAVNPTTMNGTMEVTRKKVRRRSSQNVNELERECKRVEN